MLFLRRLRPPNEAWLLDFFALVLTVDFIRVSVTVVEMMLMRSTKGLVAEAVQAVLHSLYQRVWAYPNILLMVVKVHARTVHFTTNTLFPCLLPCMGSLKA
jgi:hypothetical protein